MRCSDESMVAPSSIDVLGTPAVGLWAGTLHLGERRRPLRRTERAWSRWVANAALGLMAGAVERVLVLPALTLAARHAARREWGLLPRCLPQGIVRDVVALVALDCGVYAWHRLSHECAPFWRLHRVHHTDLALDLTTTIRLHPGELVASIVVRGAQVLLLGPSVRAVATYELLLQAASTFHHANLDLGATIDRQIGRVFMTPRLHARHHSATPDERAGNWGVVLSLWDRLFGSYDARPARDPRLGTATARDPRRLRARALLTMPWSHEAAAR
jgi:sterol desaturase/sphingolipid hydroxylase (fatty acid hydroxylase superfamily)